MRDDNTRTTTDPHGSVPCHTDGPHKALELARNLADHLGQEAYVLLGYRPNARGFRSPTYYVSKIPAPKIVVDGLPSANLVGPPFSGPLLLEKVPPVHARRAKAKSRLINKLTNGAS